MKTGYGIVYDPRAIGLDVRNKTGDEVIVICPYHNDHHASAEFNVRTGLFHCFSCGVSSNAEKLAKRLGGTCLTKVSRYTTATPDVNWRPLLDAPLALDHWYMRQRHVTNEQVIRHGIRVVHSGIVIPLLSKTGRVVGVMGRRFKGLPRYMVLGERPPLWPMPVVVHHPPLVKLAVVEGIFGVLAAERAGIPAVASMTCRANEDAVKWLRRGRVVVCYDGDRPGYIGAGKLLVDIPHAEVMAPGQEFDELTPGQWQELWSGDYKTRSHAVLASLSGNKELYNAVVKPPARRQRS